MRTRTSEPPANRRSQRGAALLTAMIIVTLVATLAASMVWQQWRAVQVESAERARTASARILEGARDFAQLILNENLKAGSATTLNQPWASPLAEARLSSFLAVDKTNADDGPEAFLSGGIADAQARYNLTNLVIKNPLPKGYEVDPLELDTLVRICSTAGLDSGVAQRIAFNLRDAMAASDGVATTAATAIAPLLPNTLKQLAWFGIGEASVAALQPYVVLLPGNTELNVNTASREVLAAVIKELGLAGADRVVQVRQRTEFTSLQQFTTLAGLTTLPAAKLSVTSSFFEVQGRLRLDDRVLVERTLLRRLGGGKFTLLQRERISSVDQVGK
jgi:general secretion pathway protein K